MSWHWIAYIIVGVARFVCYGAMFLSLWELVQLIFNSL